MEHKKINKLIILIMLFLLYMGSAGSVFQYDYGSCSIENQLIGFKHNFIIDIINYSVIYSGEMKCYI